MRNKNKQIKWQIINSILFFMILSMSGYYVATVNNLTIEGLKRGEYRKEVEYQKEKNRELNVQISLNKSYEALVQRTDNLKMVAVNNVDYVDSSGKLALKMK